MKSFYRDLSSLLSVSARTGFCCHLLWLFLSSPDSEVLLQIQFLPSGGPQGERAQDWNQTSPRSAWAPLLCDALLTANGDTLPASQGTDDRARHPVSEPYALKLRSEGKSYSFCRNFPDGSDLLHLFSFHPCFFLCLRFECVVLSLVNFRL